MVSYLSCVIFETREAHIRVVCPPPLPKKKKKKTHVRTQYHSHPINHLCLNSLEICRDEFISLISCTASTISGKSNTHDSSPSLITNESSKSSLKLDLKLFRLEAAEGFLRSFNEPDLTRGILDFWISKFKVEAICKIVWYPLEISFEYSVLRKLNSISELQSNITGWRSFLRQKHALVRIQRASNPHMRCASCGRAMRVSLPK